MRSSQVTIKDIARELGISPSTVSRALKDHPDISPETKKAVNELASRVNYQPNAVALSLKHSKRFTIGVIIPETVHYFFSTVISGIEDVAYNAGYNVMICQSNERYDRELSNAQMLYSNRVDGLLVSLAKETKNLSHLKFFQDNNIPVVFFDRATDVFPCDKVIIDDYKASYEATKFLIGRGHTNLVHLAAPLNLQIGRDRQKGFVDAIIDSGLTLKNGFIIPADNYTNGQNKIKELLDIGKKPDGIFAVNDLTALGAMQSLKKAGLKIPDDVGVVGFSNGQYSEIIEPPLTTIDQNGYEMGKIAAQLLLKRIDSDEEEFIAETHIVTTELIIRGSTK
jgi:DNA-binding LacI/PurR family transcriptional regulator